MPTSSSSSSSGSGSSSSSGQGTPFHSSPQQFNKTRRKAAETVQHLVSLLQKGPRTMVGTVADTSFHLTMGYVLCQTQLGIVQVYGVPVGSVIQGMRVYCRQIGGMGSNRHFVFDGAAPALSSLGASGSIIMAGTPARPLASGVAMASGLFSQSTTAITGYYWFCFFYFPALPSVSATIFQFAQDGNASATLTLELLPTGLLQFRSGDGHGYITTQPVVPHSMHFVLIQPGLMNQELSVDGTCAYTGLLTTPDLPSFPVNGLTYTMSLLSNVNGTHLCPVGSWISKIGYGYLAGSDTISATGVPQQDSDLYNGAATYALYPCSDPVGSSSLTNVAAGTQSPVGLQVTPPAQLVLTGPY